MLQSGECRSCAKTWEWSGLLTSQWDLLEPLVNLYGCCTSNNFMEKNKVGPSGFHSPNLWDLSPVNWMVRVWWIWLVEGLNNCEILQIHGPFSRNVDPINGLFVGGNGEPSARLAPHLTVSKSLGVGFITAEADKSRHSEFSVRN